MKRVLNIISLVLVLSRKRILNIITLVQGLKARANVRFIGLVIIAQGATVFAVQLTMCALVFRYRPEDDRIQNTFVGWMYLLESASTVFSKSGAPHVVPGMKIWTERLPAFFAAFKFSKFFFSSAEHVFHGVGASRSKNGFRKSSRGRLFFLFPKLSAELAP